MAHRLHFLPALFLGAILVSVAKSQGPAVSSTVTIGRVKYAGGGDWYNDPSAEVNLARYALRVAGLPLRPVYEAVEISSDRFFSYPLLFLTGHGNIALTDAEARRLRTYLENGGFLYADDDYGMDRAFRREMKKVFPDRTLVEVPLSDPLYHLPFPFPQGPPKTHEHDGGAPRGFGLYHQGRLVVYYTYESNPSDGWADAEVHHDPEEKREEALRFGTNIFVRALTR